MSIHVIRDDCFLNPSSKIGKFDLIIADPPYVEILKEEWDHHNHYDRLGHAIVDWLTDGGTAYVWGGTGTFKSRPFFEWVSKVEKETELRIHNWITWSKKRAYGKQDNFLYTREECVMLVKGKKPKAFNIPLLDVKRGYAGYNSKYPAKSEFLRRTNVWTDITELFRGKIHPAEKPSRLAEIMIETSSHEGDRILDPFAGCGSTGLAAIKYPWRECVLIEMSDCPMHEFGNPCES